MPQPLQIRQCHPRPAEPGTPRPPWPSCVQRATSAARPVERLGSCQRHAWGPSHGGTDGPITPCCRRITPWPGKGKMPCTSGSWATTPCMLGAERGAREKASLFSGGKVCEGLRTRPSAFCSAGSAGGSTGNVGSTGSTGIAGVTAGIATGAAGIATGGVTTSGPCHTSLAGGVMLAPEAAPGPCPCEAGRLAWSALGLGSGLGLGLGLALALG